MKLGLRFSRSQIRTLRNIRDWAKANDVPGDLSLYDKAIESVEDNEPLVVICDDRAEVEQMAAAFVNLGVKRPAIEELSG
jgi:hypothetical protein